MVHRLSCVVLLVSCSVVGFAQNVDDREAPIRLIVGEQAKAWDAGDAAAFSRQIAPGVSFTNLFGMVM